MRIESTSDQFHVYAIEWTADRIDFMIDGKVYHTFLNDRNIPDSWPFDQPFHLLLNLTVGGNWGATKGIDDTIWPQRLEVDYVRIYRYTKDKVPRIIRGKWNNLV